MSKSAHLRQEDVRTLLRLVGECRELGDHPVAWRQHLCACLGRLTGAAMACVGEFTGGVHSPLNVLGGVDWGWEDGLDRDVWLEALTSNPDMRDSPVLEQYLQRQGLDDGCGQSRKDLLSDRDWYRSPYYQRIHASIGIDHTLVSFVKVPGTQEESAALALCRAASDRHDFSLRHRVFLQELQVALKPLIGSVLARFTEPSPADLSPRLRQVLRCLLEGDSDKQIARRLGISGYTVNQYTKTLYRHFGVQGRAELLSLWLRRAYPSGFTWAD